MVYASQSLSSRCDGVLLMLAVCAGSIPEELGNLNRLEDLRLYDNELTGKGRIP